MLRHLRHSTSAWMLCGACAWTAAHTALAAPPGSVAEAIREPAIFPLPLSVERIEDRRPLPPSVVNVSYPDGGVIRDPSAPARQPLVGVTQAPATPRTASLPQQPLPQQPGTYYTPPQQAGQPAAQYMLVPVLVQPNGTLTPQMPAAGPQWTQPQPQPAVQPYFAQPPRLQDRPRELRSADEQVRRLAKKAAGLAERQALYAARKEFEQALRTAAQALDAPAGDDLHLKALNAALIALEEAEDFAPRSQAPDDLTVAEIAGGHRSCVLNLAEAQRMNGLAALQMYYRFAQQQLTIAVGGLPASAEALFGLGKVQTLLGNETGPLPQMYTARAIVFHQTALAIDNTHSQAANELGVLLARAGDWREAKETLLASVRVRPDPTTWRNLARVHERLGEIDLARRAEYERSKLVGENGDNSQGVQWIDASAFARMSPPPANAPPANYQPAPLYNQPTTARGPAAQPVSTPVWTPPAPVRR